MSEFLLQVRQATRRLGLADATEQSYTGWIKRFILFHQFQSAAEISRLPRTDIETFAKRIKQAAQATGISKRVTPYILRHSFAVSMRKRGYTIAQI